MTDKMESFFEAQLREWTTARDNHEALTQVWSRELTSTKLPTALRVQCNPARIVSTGASIDKASIAAIGFKPEIFSPRSSYKASVNLVSATAAPT